MYGSSDETIERVTSTVISGLKEGRYKRLGTGATVRAAMDRLLGSTPEQRIEQIDEHGPVCIWDVSGSVSLMYAASPYVFENDPTFTSDLFWNTSECTDMTGMLFRNAEFSGDLSTWDVSNVTKMASMFDASGVSDSGIKNWGVGKLDDASYMFRLTPKISPELDLSEWNVSNVRTFYQMFDYSAVVDSGIGKWRLRKDATTSFMFRGTSFKGKLGSGWTEAQIQSALMYQRDPHQGFGTRGSLGSQGSRGTSVRKTAQLDEATPRIEGAFAAALRERARVHR